MSTKVRQEWNLKPACVVLTFLPFTFQTNVRKQLEYMACTASFLSPPEGNKALSACEAIFYSCKEGARGGTENSHPHPHPFL